MNGEQLSPVGSSPELPRPVETGVGNHEAAPDLEKSRESKEQAPVAPAEPVAQTPVAQVPQPVALPQPTVPPSVDDSLAQNPVVANDDELIEKEWVSRSKKIVHETKGDPHRREVEVSKLKTDYRNKRWNKDVKLVSE